MKKLFYLPFRLLAWIIMNLEASILLMVFVISGLPFLGIQHSDTWYTALGGICSFTSAALIYARTQEQDQKESTLYSLIGLIILVLGLIGFFVMGAKRDVHHFTSLELFLTTHLGALLGIVFGGFFFGELMKIKKKNSNN